MAIPDRRVGKKHLMAIAASHHDEVPTGIQPGRKADNHRSALIGELHDVIKRAAMPPGGVEAKEGHGPGNSGIFQQPQLRRDLSNAGLDGQEIVNAILTGTVIVVGNLGHRSSRTSSHGPLVAFRSGVVLLAVSLTDTDQLVRRMERWSAFGERWSPYAGRSAPLRGGHDHHACDNYKESEFFHERAPR